MVSIHDLMIELEGADLKKVNRIASEQGSLPVRLAMLGLSSIKKATCPLWWGYPPGVFISYKWDGNDMRDTVSALSEYIRGQGYRAYLDVENLDESADAYFQIPQFITTLQECSFYILLLTEKSADLMTGRKGKTSWIHDEYQYAVQLANSGRLFIIPVLLETKGMTDNYTRNNVIDLTKNRCEFDALNDILAPNPITMNEDTIEVLTSTVAQFDAMFLNEQWVEAEQLLQSSQDLIYTFDYQFRHMLLSIYTANRPSLDTTLAQLHAVYGKQIVSHFYKGYCSHHNIPNQLAMD